MPENSDPKRGYKLLSYNVVVVAFFFLLLDYTLRTFEIDSFQAIFWGYTSSLFLTGIFVYPQKKFRKSTVKTLKNYWKLIIALGFLVAASASALVYSISDAGSGPIVLIGNAHVIFSFILGSVFLGERFTWKEIGAALLMILGIVLIAGLRGEVNLVTAMVALFSAFGFSMRSLLIRKFARKASMFDLVFLRSLAALIPITIFIFATGRFILPPWEVICFLAVAYIFGLMIGRLFYYRAHRFLGISRINIFLLLQPVLVVTGAYFIFGDTISTQKALGAGLIVIGAYFFTRCHTKRAQIDSKADDAVILSD